MRRGAIFAWAAATCSLAGCAAAPPVSTIRASGAVVNESLAQALISEYRRSHGLSAVALDPQLQRAAEKQALAMARTDTLSHTVAGSLSARLNVEHISTGDAAENVSAGYDRLQQALIGWEKSPPHNANLLGRSYERMGIGSAYAPGSRYRRYWSLILTD